MGIALEDNTPMVATAFRGSDLTEEEESALDYLFDMMTAVKQQVLLRKALHSQSPHPFLLNGWGLQRR